MRRSVLSGPNGWKAVVSRRPAFSYISVCSAISSAQYPPIFFLIYAPLLAARQTASLPRRQAQFLESISGVWMSVEQANRRHPAFGQKGVRWDFSFVAQVIEDLLNHLRVFDAGDDVHGRTNAASAGDCMDAGGTSPWKGEVERSRSQSREQRRERLRNAQQR
ncbi:MAG: hypothetical protein OEQ39_21890 [Gammaproteobacteria bacterium]|nr:hypothetical protein [Gammaproteobacteria bacterium]